MKTKYLAISQHPEISVIVPHGKMSEAREIYKSCGEFDSHQSIIRAFRAAGFTIKDERDDVSALAESCDKFLRENGE